MTRTSRFQPMTILTIAVATLLFNIVVRGVSGLWLDLTLRPELREALDQSLSDQKALRRLDPANQENYRRRFEQNQRLVHLIDVIRMNREALRSRFELILTAAFAVTLTAIAVVWSVRHKRNVERKRREYLDRLTSWQEASRRHAHEIRTPLTAARLEIDRLISLTRERTGEDPEIVRVAGCVVDEFERVTRFTRNFSSFAAVDQTLLVPLSLSALVGEFCELFADAWPNLTLQRRPSRAPISIRGDRDLLRQVLVNLCANSARAVNGQGTITFTLGQDGDQAILDVSDNGSGIAPSIRSRIFEPYVTTRNIGEGMGLGLAISRKILLDHGGDLALMASSDAGTTFRLTLPLERERAVES
jgi:signal transduction histidine kinase